MSQYLRTVFSIFILPLFLIVFSLNTTLAQSNDDEQLVKIRLVTEITSIQPGAPFWIGLHQDIKPGWHTYWKNPGDSGLPTEIDWELSEGTTVSDIVWPYPHRKSVESIINYGYEDQVVLLSRVTPPADLKPGENFTIIADASWLVCEEVCIPESGKAEITLPISNNTPDMSSDAPLIQKTFDSLPKDIDTPVNAEVKDDNLHIAFSDKNFIPRGEIRDAYFFSEVENLIEHSATQKIKFDNNTVTVDAPLSNTNNIPQSIQGVFVITSDFEHHAFAVKADVASSAATPSSQGIEENTRIEDIGSHDDIVVESLGTETRQGMTLLTALLFAFVGGIILNLMPCVFPILSMKALHLTQHAHHEDKKHIRLGGVFYTLGVLVSFAILGAILLGIRSTGQSIGWGIQLQSPLFVMLLVYLMVGVGIMLTGAAEIGQSMTNIGHRLTGKHGHSGSFFTGALAVIVATPCTAPFMGGAIFFALTQPWYVSLFVLQALGLGLALPYLLIAFSPKALSWLPKPGLWMTHFKQFLAFPMFAAAAWLIWVLSQQAGVVGVQLSLTGVLLIAFGLWLFGTLQKDASKNWWHVVKWLLVIGSVATAIYLTTIIKRSDVCEFIEPVSTSETVTLQHQEFSPALLKELQAQNEPVFVNMTAAWCVTCLANERVALGTDRVQNFLRDNGIKYLKGDWTNYDPDITQYLEQYNRSGVPIYVYYPRGYASGEKEAVVLPQLLTANTVIQALEKAEL